MAELGSAGPGSSTERRGREAERLRAALRNAGAACDWLLGGAAAAHWAAGKFGKARAEGEGDGGGGREKARAALRAPIPIYEPTRVPGPRVPGDLILLKRLPHFRSVLPSPSRVVLVFSFSRQNVSG